MFIQTGDSTGIGGFIISGSAPKHVLLRAIGPELAQHGVGLLRRAAARKRERLELEQAQVRRVELQAIGNNVVREKRFALRERLKDAPPETAHKGLLELEDALESATRDALEGKAGNTDAALEPVRARLEPA